MMKDKTIYCVDQGGGKSQVNITKDQSPTLTTTHGGEPVVCLNDQGGSVMEVSEDVTATLRAQEHGHQPIILESNQNHATIQTDGICTTLPASMGMGGGYVPMVVEPIAFEPGAASRVGGHIYEDGVTGTLRAEAGDNQQAILCAGFKPGQSADAHGLGYEEEVSVTLSTSQNQAVVAYGIDQQGGKGMVGYGIDVSPTLAAESHGTPHAVCYGISAYDSNAMKSPNPHSGIYEADTTRTLDLNGGNPACNQGGMMVVQQSSSNAVCMDAHQHYGYKENEVIGTLTVDQNRTVRGDTALVVEPVVYPGVNITSPINGTNPQPGDPCHTLTNDNRNYVVFTQNEREEVRDLGDKSGSLSAESGTHQQTYVLENHPNDSRIKICEDDTFQTLSGRMGTGGNNTPMVMETSMAVESHAQDARYNIGEINQTLGANMQHDPANGGLVYGVDTYNQTQSEEQAKTLNSAATDSDHIPCTYKGDTNMSNNAVVRRLTPRECERLQGMPDGWCDIGEWVDENGKKHKDADAPKYKALGNGIALPFWQWLAYRVTDQLKADGVENPTLFSMFDGIGSFCLAFKRAGCEPVAVSEIEPYPIAVCKKHFGDEDLGIDGDVEKYL